MAAAVAAVVAEEEVEEVEEAVVVEVAADSKNDCEYPFDFFFAFALLYLSPWLIP